MRYGTRASTNRNIGLITAYYGCLICVIDAFLRGIATPPYRGNQLGRFTIWMHVITLSNQHALWVRAGRAVEPTPTLTRAHRKLGHSAYVAGIYPAAHGSQLGNVSAHNSDTHA